MLFVLRSLRRHRRATAKEAEHRGANAHRAAAAIQQVTLSQRSRVSREIS